MRVVTAILRITIKMAGTLLGGCVGAAIGFALGFGSGYFIGTAALLVIYAAVPIGGLFGAVIGYLWSSASFTFWEHWFLSAAQANDDAV